MGETQKHEINIQTFTLQIHGVTLQNDLQIADFPHLCGGFFHWAIPKFHLEAHGPKMRLVPVDGVDDLGQGPLQRRVAYEEWHGLGCLTQ